MKKWCATALVMCAVLVAAPSYAFFDYLFSGGDSRDAIDNSAIGELRAWWTGNPVYNFNPYYSGPAQNPVGPNQPQQDLAAQQPTVNFYPPGGGAYYGQPIPQAAPPAYPGGGYQQPQYGLPVQQYPGQPQVYQPAPQMYQAPMPLQTYQAPQTYQPLPAPQVYQGGMPAGYPQAYPAANPYQPQ